MYLKTLFEHVVAKEVDFFAIKCLQKRNSNQFHITKD